MDADCHLHSTQLQASRGGRWRGYPPGVLYDSQIRIENPKASKWSAHLSCSTSGRKAGQKVKKSRNLEAGAEAEAVEEGCGFLACSLRLA